MACNSLWRVLGLGSLAFNHYLSGHFLQLQIRILFLIHFKITIFSEFFKEPMFHHVFSEKCRRITFVNILTRRDRIVLLDFRLQMKPKNSELYAWYSTRGLGQNDAGGRTWNRWKATRKVSRQILEEEKTYSCGTTFWPSPTSGLLNA